MAHGPLTFRQNDVTRALKAAVKAGIEVQRIEIDKQGKIVMVTGKPPTEDGAKGGGNEWDRI